MPHATILLEERLGIQLDRLGPDAVVLHHRRMPGSRAKIDHLVVAPSAIWVIDSKHRRRAVERREFGGWFRYDERLFVDGRDESALVLEMGRQVMAVRNALIPATPRIRPVICFSGAEWPACSDFELDGVLVTWPRALANEIERAPGTQIDVNALAASLAARLPSARSTRGRAIHPSP